MTPDDIASLATPAGQLLLDSLPSYDADLALKLSDGLRRRGLDPALVAAALTQSRLRDRAATKLGPFARTMLFTDAGLQQATRLSIAARHAARFRDVGLTSVADLTCGIGVDAMAMASLGLRVYALEIDPATAAAAAHNLRHFPTAKVVEADALTHDWAAARVDGVFADPSRRNRTGRRIHDPRAYSPPLDTVLRLADRYPLGLKVAPGIPHTALPAGAEAQWVSDAGAVLECGLWTGPLGRGIPGRRAVRSALVLGDGHSAEIAETPGAHLDAGPLGAYLFEPDGAVIRASLIAEAAEAAQLPGPRLVHPRIAYVTADGLGPASDTMPLFTAYRVVDVFGYKADKLRGYVRALGVGELIIKKRGIDVNPDILREFIHPRGEGSATVVLTRVEGRHSVIVVEPCRPGRPTGEH